MKMPLDMEVGLGSNNVVLDGDPGPPSKRGTAPPIFACLYCSQTAGWIRILLGIDAGLGPGHIVLNGGPSFPQKRGTAPNFRPMSIVAKRLDGSRYHLVRR